MRYLIITLFTIALFPNFFNSHLIANDEIQLSYVESNNKISLRCNRGGTREISVSEKEFEKKNKIKLECQFFDCKDSKLNSYIFIDFENNLFPTLVKYNEQKPLALITEWSTSSGEFKVASPNISFLSINLNLQDEHKLCNGSITKKLNYLSEQKKNTAISIATTNLIQALTLMHGQVSSMLSRSSETSLCNYSDKVLVERESSEILSIIKDQNVYSGPKKDISKEKANELFKQLAENEELPWGWSDGCFARAEIVADILKAEGVESDKIWITGNIKNPKDDSSWNFHVANVVYIKENNVIEKYVLDPAISKGPIKHTDWVKKLRSKDSTYFSEISFPIPVNYVPDEMTVYAFSDSIYYANAVDANSMNSKERNLEIAKRLTKTATEQIKQGKSASLMTSVTGWGIPSN